MVQWVASRPGALGQSYWTQQVLKNKKQTGRGEGCVGRCGGGLEVDMLRYIVYMNETSK